MSEQVHVWGAPAGAETIAEWQGREMASAPMDGTPVAVRFMFYPWPPVESSYDQVYAARWAPNDPDVMSAICTPGWALLDKSVSFEGTGTTLEALDWMPLPSS